MTISEKLQSLNIELPSPPPPGGLYKPVIVSGKYLYVSGQGPFQNDGTYMFGKVGSDLTKEEGKLAARQVALTMLSTIKTHFGPLDSIKRIVKTLGMVNSEPDFYEHPFVINGFSELLRDLWGTDNGVGARSAVGMILPLNTAVEIEAIFELH